MMAFCKGKRVDFPRGRRPQPMTGGGNEFAHVNLDSGPRSVLGGLKKLVAEFGADVGFSAILADLGRNSPGAPLASVSNHKF